MPGCRGGSVGCTAGSPQHCFCGMSPMGVMVRLPSVEYASGTSSPGVEGSPIGVNSLD